MPLIAFLLFSTPCFARLYIDYTQSPSTERPIANAAALVTPVETDRAESLGYAPRDIAVRIVPSLMASHDMQSLSEAMASASKRGRYAAAVDLRGLGPALRDNLKKTVPDAARSAKVKNFFFIEEEPLRLPSEASAQDAALFTLTTNVAAGAHALVDASLPRTGYAAEVLGLALHPRVKGEVLSWKQGFAVVFPDAVFAYNGGALGVCTLPKGLFKKKGAFPARSRSGHMVLWEEGDTYKMLMMPQSAAFWRMK